MREHCHGVMATIEATEFFSWRSYGVWLAH